MKITTETFKYYQKKATYQLGDLVDTLPADFWKELEGKECLLFSYYGLSYIVDEIYISHVCDGAMWYLNASRPGYLPLRGHNINWFIMRFM